MYKIANNFFIKNIREMFTEIKSCGGKFYLEKHIYNVYLSLIVFESLIFFLSDALFFNNSFCMALFYMKWYKNIYIFNTICQETKIREVKVEYRILHFACDKNSQIYYYYSRNHYNNLTNHIKDSFFTQAIKIVPFSILASFLAKIATVRCSAGTIE